MVDAWVKEICNDTWTSTKNDAIYAAYTRGMMMISYANEFLRNTNDGDPEVAAERAEVRFLRAYAYWILLDCFGNPPFVLETDPVGTFKPQQTDAASLFAWLKTELEQLTGENSNLMAPHTQVYPRVDKGAAYGLLARLCLNHKTYLGQEDNEIYEAAKNAAKQVIDAYGLAKNYEELFMGDNGGAQFMAKGTLYENGIRVPLMIRWPGRVPAAVSDALVSNVDLAATCLAAAGLPVPEEIEGENLLPLLTEGKTPGERHVYSIRSCHATNSLPKSTAVFDQMRCIVGERYKLIYNLLPGQPWVPVDFSGTAMFRELARMNESGELEARFRKLYFSPTRPMFELFDLENDPFEQHNLADDPAMRSVRDELILKLTYKMIEDEDFATLPHPKIYE